MTYRSDMNRGGPLPLINAVGHRDALAPYPEDTEVTMAHGTLLDMRPKSRTREVWQHPLV